MVAGSRPAENVAGPVRYVIVEVRKRDNGPPFLPRDKEAVVKTQLDCWYQPDKHIHLAEYLSTFLQVITGLSWSGRVTRVVNGSALVPYQAGVEESVWSLVWDSLLKPYASMRSVYRKVHNCKNGPELFFGMEGKFVAPVAAVSEDAVRCEVQLTSPDRHDVPVSSDVPDSDRGSKFDELPRFDVPVMNTFVHFPDTDEFCKRNVLTL
jgi:hypothetical protein